MSESIVICDADGNLGSWDIAFQRGSQNACLMRARRCRRGAACAGQRTGNRQLGALRRDICNRDSLLMLSCKIRSGNSNALLNPLDPLGLHRTHLLHHVWPRLRWRAAAQGRLRVVLQGELDSLGDLFPR